MARRRKEDGRVGSASRGMVRRWGRFFSRVLHRGVTSAVTLPPGRNGPNARRMAVLSTFRAPSLCRHVHRELLRSVLLDVTPIISATACHQRNYVERYSRYRGGSISLKPCEALSHRARPHPLVEGGVARAGRCHQVTHLGLSLSTGYK